MVLAVADDPRLTKAIELIREVLLAEYAKGAQDAIARITAIAKAEFGTPQDEHDEPDEDEDEAPDETRRRAPRGLVRVLITRSLTEVAPRGLTTNEFKDRAKDDVERMISMGSIRNELRRGAADGRYREEGGRWFLVTSSPKQRGHQ
jgi:hypothetical protein